MLAVHQFILNFIYTWMSHVGAQLDLQHQRTMTKKKKDYINSIFTLAYC